MRTSYIIGIVAFVAVVGFIFGYTSFDTKQANGGGGTVTRSMVNSPVSTNFDSLGLRDSNSQVYKVMRHEYEEINSGKDQAFWLNSTGQTIYAGPTNVFMNGVASSSYKIYVATSSTSTITSGGAPFSSLIDGASLATSTATTTFNSVANAGTNGKNYIQVKNGEYLVLLLNSIFGTTCTSSVCEAATSTNRGFNLKWDTDWFTFNSFN